MDSSRPAILVKSLSKRSRQQEILTALPYWRTQLDRQNQTELSLNLLTKQSASMADLSLTAPNVSLVATGRYFSRALTSKLPNQFLTAQAESVSLDNSGPSVT